MNNKHFYWIIPLCIIIIIGGIYLFYPQNKTGELVTENFEWNGVDGVAQYSGTTSSSCASSSGLVTISNDVIIKSIGNSDSCQAQGSNAGIELKIINISKLKSIYISLDSKVSGDEYSSVSASLALMQGTYTYFSISESKGMYQTQTTGNIPDGILIKIEDGYVTIPSISSTYPLLNTNDMKLIFSTSSGSHQAGKTTSESKITLNDIKLEYNTDPDEPDKPDTPFNILVPSLIALGLIGSGGLVFYLVKRKK